MNDPTRVVKPVNEELPREVVDLVDAVHELPAECQAKLEQFVLRVVDNSKRRRRILALVQDALGQLRLDMKYLTFDLEATRRERDDYRKKLEGTP